MSHQVPTISEIETTIISQLEGALNQSFPLFPKAFNRVIAKVLAGVTVLLYKYAGFMFLQMFVQFATLKETTINGRVIKPLESWGVTYGIGSPTLATRAVLTQTITVLTQTGQINAGTQLTNALSGVIYATITDVTLSAATVTVDVKASGTLDGGTGSGTIGNLGVGDILTFINTQPNVVDDTVVAAVVTTAADEETEEAYRSRVTDAVQKEPQGGAYADYEKWGETTPGIINVYPYTGDPGQVNLYSEATVASSGNDDGIPTASQLVEVKENVEVNEAGLATRRNVNAFVNSYAITRLPFFVTVIGLTADDSTTAEENVTKALDGYFADREPFIPGLSILPRRDQITATAIGGVIQGVMEVTPGGAFSGSILRFGGSAIATYSLGEGEKAKVEVTYP